MASAFPRPRSASGPAGWIVDPGIASTAGVCRRMNTWDRVAATVIWQGRSAIVSGHEWNETVFETQVCYWGFNGAGKKVASTCRSVKTSRGFDFTLTAPAQSRRRKPEEHRQRGSGSAQARGFVFSKRHDPRRSRGPGSKPCWRIQRPDRVTLLMNPRDRRLSFPAWSG